MKFIDGILIAQCILYILYKGSDYMNSSMAAKHAIWPRNKDIIFGLAGRAQEAESNFGRENVINATLGSIVDDDGKIVAFKTVYDEYRSLDNAEFCAYASIEGQPHYLEAVKKACFKGYAPEGYIKAVASPGGSGAIKLALWNYTDYGDNVITSDWYWGSYDSIAEEGGRSVVTYKLFDENGGFNFPSFKERFLDLSKKQDRIFTIINTPAHNPTGYNVTEDEWDKILELAKEVSKDESKKIIFLVDVAYIDYAGDDKQSRGFFKKFSNLPDNIFTIVAYSMSKGFTAYGMRMGAIIGISSNSEVVEEFYYSCTHTCRATWSNCNRSAMTLLSNIINNPEKMVEYEAEKEKYKKLLEVRAKAFVDESKKIGLEILPYRVGFFISIPCDDPMGVVEELTKHNLFAVPLEMGVRFAICSVAEDKCKASPKIIKSVLEEMVPSGNM